MKLILLETPYAGDVVRNVRYARLAMRHCLMRGEAPMASHLIYTQEGVLRDEVAAERLIGMEAGFAWAAHAQLVAVYTDIGISEGMRRGLDVHEERGIPIEWRTIPGWEG